MTKLGKKLWKQTFPFICDECFALHSNKREFCSHCGLKDSLRSTTRSDYKIWRLEKSCR